jgi:hypothetical protein
MRIDAESVLVTNHGGSDRPLDDVTGLLRLAGVSDEAAWRRRRRLRFSVSTNVKPSANVPGPSACAMLRTLTDKSVQSDRKFAPAASPIVSAGGEHKTRPQATGFLFHEGGD